MDKSEQNVLCDDIVCSNTHMSSKECGNSIANINVINKIDELSRAHRHELRRWSLCGLISAPHIEVSEELGIINKDETGVEQWLKRDYDKCWDQIDRLRNLHKDNLSLSSSCRDILRSD